MILKECVICGDEFQAVQSTRQYCDRCQKNSAKAREYQEKKLIASKYRLGEMPSQQMKQKFCIYCNREFHTYYDGRKFCSDDCRGSYNIEHAECIVCKTLLYPLGIEKRSGRGYCSDKCKQQKQLEDAAKRGDVIPCKRCGKQFIRKKYSNEFCSNECWLANKAMTKSEPYVAKKVSQTCEICGTIFERYENAKVYTCKAECRDKRKKIKAEEARDKRRAERARTAVVSTNRMSIDANIFADSKTLKRESAIKAVLSGELKGKEARELHLCIECKTSQKQCLMFTSNFTQYPEGVKMQVIDGQVVVLVCPQHT